jgi:hypothetical protein
MLRAILTVPLQSASISNGGATMKMTGTWVKRGSTIELLDGDPPTRSTREFAGEEGFLSEVPSSATPSLRNATRFPVSESALTSLLPAFTDYIYDFKSVRYPWLAQCPNFYS